MRHLQPLSRQSSAGPSGSKRPKHRGASRPKPILSTQVIELSDSDDDQLILPPLKRQRIDVDYQEVRDKVLFNANVGRAATKKTTDKEEHGDARQSKSQESAFNDLTNELNQRETQPLHVPMGEVIINAVIREEPIDPRDRYLSQVLEVVPDVNPEHARSLIDERRASSGDQVVATVLHLLLENPYPKVERNKGKRKREDGDSSETRGNAAKIDYGSKNRNFEGGGYYREISLNQLITDFPRIPLPHIRQVLSQNNYFYAPTHLVLRAQLNEKPPPFKIKANVSRPSGKGKQHDAEFERELAWLLGVLESKPGEGADESNQINEDNGECEDGIECGCCFSSYVFDKIVQCPDAHLFCASCVTSYAENQLGQHDPNIRCMDQSGCKLAFADAELKRFLPQKLIYLYERVKQAKEIEAAELDGLEECPFCEYKVVIDNPEEKLFRCEREECSAVSCRACKKPDHLPKSCKEAEEDKGLGARHKVEEAMTEALMRNCPKCKKGFIKEGGCNKMTCPSCHTLSCYVCRQIISSYDHFNQKPATAKPSKASSSKQKCPLWDSLEQRHDQEVAEARDRMIKEMKKADPKLDKMQVEVELPRTAPTVAAVGPARARVHGAMRAMPIIAGGPPGVGLEHLNFMQGIGINIDVQINPYAHGNPQPVPQRLPPPPPQAIDLNARMARMEEIAQANLEARRYIAERQERVRREYEGYRQQVDAQLQAIQDARANVAVQAQAYAQYHHAVAHARPPPPFPQHMPPQMPLPAAHHFIAPFDPPLAAPQLPPLPPHAAHPGLVVRPTRAASRHARRN